MDFSSWLELAREVNRHFFFLNECDDLSFFPLFFFFFFEYSILQLCVVAKPLNRSEARVDFVVIQTQTLLLFVCKSLCYHAN